jgi:hypothetical protein
MERFYYILFYIIKINLSPITFKRPRHRHSKDLGPNLSINLGTDIQTTSAQTFKRPRHRHSNDLGTDTDIQKTIKRPRHRHSKDLGTDIQKTSAQTLNGLLHFRTFPDILLNSRYPTQFPISTYLYFIKRG